MQDKLPLVRVRITACGVGTRQTRGNHAARHVTGRYQYVGRAAPGSWKTEQFLGGYLTNT
ncbi:TPA: hypothetical protein EYN98_06800 [Candidatus Poribacteria bacterium]|nr:hypothetical protein [Candidatus Poribacteria bacterium]HIC01472.1 hypothetical protein [Candidatus Poribacteria bacterium]HIO38188.1 hypothetical protein [Rhodospirillales bacterium]